MNPIPQLVQRAAVVLVVKSVFADCYPRGVYCIPCKKMIHVLLYVDQIVIIRLNVVLYQSNVRVARYSQRNVDASKQRPCRSSPGLLET